MKVIAFFYPKSCLRTVLQLRGSNFVSGRDEKYSQSMQTNIYNLANYQKLETGVSMTTNNYTTNLLR